MNYYDAVKYLLANLWVAAEAGVNQTATFRVLASDVFKAKPADVINRATELRGKGK